LESPLFAFREIPEPVWIGPGILLVLLLNEGSILKLPMVSESRLNKEAQLQDWENSI